MDNTGITPVMPIGGMDGAFGGGNAFVWIFGLLILLGLMNGGLGGMGGNGNANALQADVNRGFDNQNLQAQTRDILTAVNAGTAQSVAATNQTIHDVLGVMQGLYNETSRDIAALAVGLANSQANQSACCCEVKQLVQATSAATDAKIDAAKYETAMQIAAMEARLNSKLDANEITALRDKVQSLELKNAVSGVLRYPDSWAYNAGVFPPLSGAA